MGTREKRFVKKVKVYFACSVRGGGDTSLYLSIINAIKSAGGEVLSEIFVHDAINYGGSPLPVDEIYKRDTEMIKEADVMIAEVTNPSLGVGYELAYAENLDRPILCLFKKDAKNSLSAMVAGNTYNTVNYIKPEEIIESVQTFLAQAILPQTLQRKTDR
jgi:nucleoside 2-deoxyribosyltransferase